MPTDSRARHSVGFAMVVDRWSGTPGKLKDFDTALRRLGKPKDMVQRPAAPDRHTAYCALLGTNRGPLVLYRIFRGAPGTAVDFQAGLDEFIAAVDTRELSDFYGDRAAQFGNVLGIGDLIDRPSDGDRPDWVDAWFNDLGTGQKEPKVPGRGPDSSPVNQGAGRPTTRPKDPSQVGGDPWGGADKADLKRVWGVQDDPVPRFGPHGDQGVIYDSKALGVGWGSDGTDKPASEPKLVTNSEILKAGAVAMKAVALICAGIAITDPELISKGTAAVCGVGVAGISFDLDAAAWAAGVWERRAKERAAVKKQQHTPAPEDAGDKRPFDPALPWTLTGEAVFGSALNRDPRRVRFVSERDAGTSWGWVTFGAPRAQPGLLPAAKAMPSDDADESPTVWLGAEPNADHASSDDFWIAGRVGWGWSRWGAPRALVANSIG